MEPLLFLAEILQLVITTVAFVVIYMLRVAGLASNVFQAMNGLAGITLNQELERVGLAIMEVLIFKYAMRPVVILACMADL